jgi:anaerobic selenocysteine-containing dehydrogenase
LDLVTGKVLAIKEAYGPEAIAFYRPAKGGSPAADYEDLVLRLANCLGSPNTLSTGYICQWHRDSGSKYTYGAGIPQPDLEASAAILLWGFNPAHTWNNFYRVLRHAKNRGAKLIVVDPRRTEVAELADLWLPIRPGADGVLAMTMLQVLIEEGLYDENFVRDWTNAPFLVRKDTGEILTAEQLTGMNDAGEPGRPGEEPGLIAPDDLIAWDEVTASPVVYRPSRRVFIARHTPAGTVSLKGEETIRPALKGNFPIQLPAGGNILCYPVWHNLQEILTEFHPQETETLTGIPVAKVKEAAHLLGQVKPLSYYTYNGVEQHINAMQTNRALCLLYAVTGNLGRAGGNLWWPKVPTNDLAGREYLPPAQEAKRLGLEKKPLGPAATRRVVAHDLYTAILEERPYPVKALLSFGGNLLNANPNSGRGAKALAALDFYLQVDFFLTPAAVFADVVLPAATPWEGWYVRAGFGLAGRAARTRVQLRERVVPPLYESRPDPEIIFDLAVKLGLGDKFWQGDLEKALNYHLAPTGFTVAELRRHPGGVDYPLTPVTSAHASRDPKTGAPVGFQTPSGRVEIYSITLARHGYPALPDAAQLKTEPLPEFAHAFPLTLTNFKLREFCHGQHRAVPFLRRKVPYPYVEVHPDTAAELNLSDGQWVKLETPYGSIQLKVKVTDFILPGVVATQHGWWQSCPELGLPGFDPLSAAGSNVNLIINDDRRDPVTGSIPIKSYRCRLVTR